MPEKKKTVFIGVGSNLGDRKANIEKALELVNLIKGVKLLRVSSIYETEPQDGPPQGNFLNGVFEVKTTRSPFNLLNELQKIEKHLGKKRKVKNGPRAIDLDILTFGERKVNTRDLKIPHPRMHRREFVLQGLRQLQGLK